jgi:hypothetical protein
LFKAGAEKLCLTFRLAPCYHIERERDGEHLDVTATCTLTHIPSGQEYGSGLGSCSTKEAKYAYRQGGRKCPACGQDAIIKGKAEWGGGWVCFKKKGGCGSKFADGSADIESQQTGRVPNPDLADAYNTVLKMACKRALVAAVLNVTAASDIFTQDVEDFGPETEAAPEPPTRPAPAQATRQQPPAPKKDAGDFVRRMEDSLIKQSLCGKGDLLRQMARDLECPEPDVLAHPYPVVEKAALSAARFFFDSACSDRMQECGIPTLADALALAGLPEELNLNFGSMTWDQLKQLLAALREQPAAVPV